MRRRIVREKVVQALYAYELSGDSVDHVVKTVLEPLRVNKGSYHFARHLVKKTVEHAADLDLIIRAKVTNWDFKRIAILDRLILRMGICELLFFRDIPPKVSMNEAIELAKLFSTERSGQFINGVLDSVMNDVKDKGPDVVLSGAVAKAGRGLYDGVPAKPADPAPDAS
jgi:N utilization substance protein B